MVQRFVEGFFQWIWCSVPAKRVLGHDRSRDLLRSDTAALAAAAALAASTARRKTSIAGAMHPSCGAARDGTISKAASCAGYRAGALVGDALVPVSAGDKEHGGSVRNGTNNSTRGDTSSGCVDRTACINVAT